MVILNISFFILLQYEYNCFKYYTTRIIFVLFTYKWNYRETGDIIVREIVLEENKYKIHFSTNINV